MTRIHFGRSAAMVALLAGWLSSAVQADPVTDFRTYRSGTSNGTAPSLTGQGTNDPIVGDLTGNPMSAGILLGYLTNPAVLGANVGDKITFSFTVRFNDATGLTVSGDNFRYALFDLNGEAQDSATGGLSGGPTYSTAGTANTDQFRGFAYGNRGGGGAGNNGSVRQRVADVTASDNPFANTAPDQFTGVGSAGGDNVVLTSDVNGNGAGFNYTGTMTLTRATGGLIDLSGTLVGTNMPEGETDNIFTSTTSVSGPSTYGAVGFLIGGPLSTDQALFTDIDVSVIPFAPPEDADFDADGDVDGADFLAWQRGVGGVNGTDLADGNANGDTAVDGADLAIWESQFGTATINASSVPEPASLALGGMALAACASIAARRRTRK